VKFASGNVTVVWSFARDLDSSDPNWTLVATSGDLSD
jgi:predicted lipid-binding transport protein (Tim44 family)